TMRNLMFHLPRQLIFSKVSRASGNESQWHSSGGSYCRPHRQRWQHFRLPSSSRPCLDWSVFSLTGEDAQELRASPFLSIRQWPSHISASSVAGTEYDYAGGSNRRLVLAHRQS